MQYEQYEQEVKNLQRLIEEAHRVIQDRPVATGNIHELQTQIQHHEVRKDILLSYFYYFYRCLRHNLYFFKYCLFTKALESVMIILALCISQSISQFIADMLS